MFCFFRCQYFLKYHFLFEIQFSIHFLHYLLPTLAPSMWEITIPTALESNDDPSFTEAGDDHNMSSWKEELLSCAANKCWENNLLCIPSTDNWQSHCCCVLWCPCSHLFHPEKCFSEASNTLEFQDSTALSQEVTPWLASYILSSHKWKIDLQVSIPRNLTTLFLIHLVKKSVAKMKMKIPAKKPSKFLKEVVIHYMPHKYSKEMAKKLEFVS